MKPTKNTIKYPRFIQKRKNERGYTNNYYWSYIIQQPINKNKKKRGPPVILWSSPLDWLQVPSTVGMDHCTPQGFRSFGSSLQKHRLNMSQPKKGRWSKHPMQHLRSSLQAHPLHLHICIYIYKNVITLNFWTRRNIKGLMTKPRAWSKINKSNGCVFKTSSVHHTVGFLLIYHVNRPPFLALLAISGVGDHFDQAVFAGGYVREKVWWLKVEEKICQQWLTTFPSCNHS